MTVMQTQGEPMGEEGGGAMTAQTVVPVFPCDDLKATLAFYNALGFATLHEQHAPYAYGSVRFEQIQIDFYGSQATAAAEESGHMCLVLSGEIQRLYDTFVGGLKQHLGRRPRSGIPRIGTLNTVSKNLRFNLIDPNGNRLIVIATETHDKPKPKRHTPLSKAISAARLDAYSRDEPTIAAEHLDQALTQLDAEPAATRFRAFVLRADIAAALGDRATLEHYLQAAQVLALAPDDLAETAEERGRLSELLSEAARQRHDEASP
jgi:catechol 2,3-dioxygenase-like lactoylglutathione lyase family enzyme